MNERRKTKRTQLTSRLLIKRMDSPEHEEVHIDILDVSKTGIGFKTDKMLKIGEMYEAFLTIWTQEVIHTMLKIVRIELQEDSYSYGAVFVGLPEMDATRIGIYQTVTENE